MKVQLSFALLSFLTLLEYPAKGFATDISAHEVMANYPRALSDLEAFYSRAAGKVRRTSHRYVDGSKATEKTGIVTYWFESKRPAMARVEYESNSKHVHHVVGYNKKYAFQLERDSDSAPFVVKGFSESGPEKELNQLADRFLRLYQDAPFRIHVSPLKNVLKIPDFKILSVEPTIIGDRKALRIRFDAPVPTQDERTLGGYFGSIVVSPDDRWVLLEYEYTGKSRTGLYTGKIDYAESESPGSPPIPKRVVHSIFQLLPSRRLLEESTFDFLEFSTRDTADRDYLLEAFGLPELSKPAQISRGDHTGYLFLGLAVAALVISIALKITSKRLHALAGRAHTHKSDGTAG